jgi:hypothetical protein
MKILSYIFLFFVVLRTAAFSQVVDPTSFKATNADADVILSWKTIDETNVKEFQIDRHSNDDPDYKLIGSVPATHQASYSFRDQTAFKKATSIYYYRLVIVFNDNTTQIFSGEASIDHTVSGVRRTWGSIKSMFRF